MLVKSFFIALSIGRKKISLKWFSLHEFWNFLEMLIKFTIGWNFSSLFVNDFFCSFNNYNGNLNFKFLELHEVGCKLIIFFINNKQK